MLQELDIILFSWVFLQHLIILLNQWRALDVALDRRIFALLESLRIKRGIVFRNILLSLGSCLLLLKVNWFYRLWVVKFVLVEILNNVFSGWGSVRLFLLAVSQVTRDQVRAFPSLTGFEGVGSRRRLVRTVFGRLRLRLGYRVLVVSLASILAFTRLLL